MSTSKTAEPGTRIQLEALHTIITRALEGGDYQHDTEWIRPESCPCHRIGASCLVPMPAEYGTCQGYPAEVPTPAEHVVSLDILFAAVPQPGADGTVDIREAALCLISEIEARLGYPYSLRRDRLRTRLIEESEHYEQAAGLTGDTAPGEPSPGSALRCAVCGGALPAGSRASRKTCSDNCRATKMRRLRARSA